MVTVAKTDLICMNCGFELREFSIFWLKRNPNLKCPVCKSTNAWKKIPYVCKDKAIDRIRASETWKKIIIAQNPGMFHNGNWKLTRKWKAYNEWIQEELENAKGNKMKTMAVNNLKKFAEKGGRDKYVKLAEEME